MNAEGGSPDDAKIVRFEDEWLNNGFTMLPNVVLLNGRLSPDARCLYGLLVFYARQSNECFPGQDRLAVMLGATDRTVRKYLRELEDQRLVRTTRRMQRSNLYTLLRPDRQYLADLVRQDPSGLTGTELPISAEGSFRTEEDAVRKKTQGEEETAVAGTSPAPGDQLFEAPAAAAAADPLDTQAEYIWTHYATVFGDRLRVKELTPPRRRTLRKALGAVAGDVQLCKRAIDGLQSYRKKNPQGSQDVSLSVVFETGPQSRSSLTDQIEWWASQADARTTGAGLKVPLDLSGVPSVSAGTIRVRREWARRKFEEPDNEYVQQQGEAALTWLREHCGHAPVFTGGRITGWRAVEA